MIDTLEKQGVQIGETYLLKSTILKDYYLCWVSRFLSKGVRTEVLNGRAKFGAGGAGKELPQVVMAHAFKKGDFLSGYYREQTFMLAKDLLTPAAYFSFLYGDADNEIYSGGRQMPNCYGTALIDENGKDLNHLSYFNVASTIAPLAAQAPRGLGLALASKQYRQLKHLDPQNQYSNQGNEVCFCAIGDASTSEGAFLEAVNAAGVMRIPIAFFIWDDGYGISVPTKYQTTKENISEILEGFRVNEAGQGLDIYTLKAYDYAGMTQMIQKGIAKVRKTHIPAIFHIRDCTQPFGHSTSGSHERYKPKERLEWEKAIDNIKVFGEWIINNGLATPEELDTIKKQAKDAVKRGRNKAWKRFSDQNETQRQRLNRIYQQLNRSKISSKIVEIQRQLKKLINPVLSHLLDNARKMQFLMVGESSGEIAQLNEWIQQAEKKLAQRYHTHLHSTSKKSALKVPEIPAHYDADAPYLNGFEILNTYFDIMLEKYPNTFAFGEDVGKIGDVNQAFAGLQKKYGEARVFDTGIREWTIAGQAIGMAMRGLRPIAEMQYLDYLAYAFAPLTDDLATIRYRSNGTQMSPAIIRTRGHRLEGIWHAGSPMGMLVHSMRGIYVLVPRNMTQAAGMYNTMLQSDDPAIIVECLNGYRLKEKRPANLDTFTVPLGQPEILQAGTDITLVTYGSCVRVAQAGIKLLAEKGISVELIDVQTLLPFDIPQTILASLKKTNRIVFMDEDVPGGATAYMMQEVLEKQDGYFYLDSKPTTITATDHRPPFGDDGNYSSKPNANDVVRVLYKMMHETQPMKYKL